MKYRDHRGHLDDSMATVQELDRAGLVKHLLKVYGDYEVVRDDLIQVKYYCYDERINWDTWIVLLNGHPVGFTNGPL